LYAAVATDGGYELAREPAEIMLGQVMRVLDGPFPARAAASPSHKSDPRQVIFTGPDDRMPRGDPRPDDARRRRRATRNSKERRMDPAAIQPPRRSA
jgi:hypothetical protein